MIFIKKIIFVLIFLGSVVFAQEYSQPVPAYYVQQPGQPVNVVPVDQLPPGAIVVTQQPYVVPVVSNPNLDSANYYFNLANYYQQTEIEGRSTGKKQLTLSIICLSVGATLVFLDAGSSEGSIYGLEGVACVVIGGIFLPIGIVKRSRYNRALRTLDEYQQKAIYFRERAQMTELYIKPEIDPVNRSLGAKFALSL